jgi:hypothetical protein
MLLLPSALWPTLCRTLEAVLGCRVAVVYDCYDGGQAFRLGGDTFGCYWIYDCTAESFVCENQVPQYYGVAHFVSCSQLLFRDREVSKNGDRIAILLTRTADL